MCARFPLGKQAKYIAQKAILHASKQLFAIFAT